MNLSQKLKKWRGAGKDGRGNKTQADAAKELGVNLRTYQDWELGRNEPRGIALRAVLERVGGK